MRLNANEKCTALTKQQKPCTWSRWQGHPWCLAHASVNGVVEAAEELTKRGVEGGRKAMEAAESAKMRTCNLRSTTGQLDQLEGALVRVANSAETACTKAGTICKLVAEARAVMRDAILEKENVELRQLLIERHPELRKQLRAVS